MTVQTKEDLLVLVMAQLIIIILAARVAGSIAVRLQQPRAVGEIIAGLALGPSLLGALAPDFSASLFSAESNGPMKILSQIGLILLMFQIGSDFEFAHLKAGKNRRAVIWVSVFSVSIPLMVGFALGQITAPILAGSIDPLVYSLFVAVALSITALPILGRILKEYSLNREDTGVIAISAAAINDVCGWVLLAAVSAVATAVFAPQNLGWQVAGLIGFALVMFTLGQRLVDWLVVKFPVENGQLPAPLLAIVLALIFAAGITTEALGIFTIFGGFVLGILFHRHAAFVEAWRKQLGVFVLVFFLPIFFTFTGLRTNVLGLDSWNDWMWCGVFFAASVLVKLIPVYFAARISGLDHHQSSMLGVLMNTRALMELIVLNIGFSLGFLPQDVFTMLVIMAVGTTIMTGPLLRMLLRRAGRPVERVAEA
jgi:Kef-type K+ transport system membrane component KefB